MSDVQNSYRYLGIPQANHNYEEASRKLTIAKYLKRVRQILESQLNGKNKVQAIKTHILPVIRYLAHILMLKQKKLLMMHGVQYHEILHEVKGGKMEIHPEDGPQS